MQPSYSPADPELWFKTRLNRSNVSRAREIWALVDGEYRPIDWSVDFKSGYRWAEGTWFRDITYGQIRGADVKVPWELARMQHLPQMALAAVEDGVSPERVHTLRAEFRNQVLDFIANNPPRFGVNWRCSMEVAIRAANWILAYTLFRTGSPAFDDSFEGVLAQSLCDHGRHIVHNLEWFAGIRANHYVANIAGLCYIAACLPSTPESDAWMAFAVQELKAEVCHQFYPDGGNFEGSTAYHRLSAEMVLHATAVAAGLPARRVEKLRAYDRRQLKTAWGKPHLAAGPPEVHNLQTERDGETIESAFPQWYFDRLSAITDFLLNVSRNDGVMTQVGDNDSGRFFKIDPGIDTMPMSDAVRRYCNLEEAPEPDTPTYFFENHLLITGVPEICQELVVTDENTHAPGRPPAGSTPVSRLYARGLLSDSPIGARRVRVSATNSGAASTVDTQSDFQRVERQLELDSDLVIRRTAFQAAGAGLHQGLYHRYYPEFGVVIYRSARLYLIVRCWAGSSPWQSAHMHNDQLSMELELDGRAVVRDPGSYLYTADPEHRNCYRSSRAHFSPWPPHLPEPAGIDRGLFRLTNVQPVRERLVSATRFLGVFSAHGYTVAREVDIGDSGIVVRDWAPPARFEHARPTFSPGYGIRERCTD